jgi:hypothetical protein
MTRWARLRSGISILVGCDGGDPRKRKVAVGGDGRLGFSILRSCCDSVPRNVR